MKRITTTLVDRGGVQQPVVGGGRRSKRNPITVDTIDNIGTILLYSFMYACKYIRNMEKGNKRKPLRYYYYYYGLYALVFNIIITTNVSWSQEVTILVYTYILII